MWQVPSSLRLSAWRRKVLPASLAYERQFASDADDALLQASRALGYRIKSGEPLGPLLPEAIGLVREASRRTLGLRQYDVQLLGGLALLRRAIVEMQTGEGKTLTALLPVVLRALTGKGMHVATANDYLAARDAETLRPVYEALGLRVGVVTADASPSQRRAAYRADITYGTAKEFGFDFLRDRIELRKRTERGGGVLGREADVALQRPPYAALIDEADAILIDEAGTPLVIGGALGATRVAEAACYRWSAASTAQFREGTDFIVSERPRRLDLTADGRRKARDLPKPREAAGLALSSLYEFIERALRVERDYLRERHYVVRDNPRERRQEVLIIDEFTGRPGEGRRWQDGIHEAIEAKEGLAIQFQESQAARVTVQSFFQRYPLLSGMTGTAAAARRELGKTYRAEVIVVPTHRPCLRRELPPRVFGTAEAKWRAVADEIESMRALGRPVLIGTRSIDRSEHLSRLLTASAIPHDVLNAYQLANEAKIVERAGEAGRVTVATNMAGRGTDIKLDDRAAAAGGLHVIGTELNESRRIDRQLSGRAARQGDPGSFRQFLALDDDILRVGLGEAAARSLQAQGAERAGPWDHRANLFRRAQRRLESRSYTARRILQYQDQERAKAYHEMGLDVYLDAPP